MLILGGFVLSFLLFAGIVAAEAWILMLFVGVVHVYFPVVPAYGFTATLVGMLALNILRSLLFGKRTQTSN